VCKGNCCCCNRCAEQLHARDPSSLAKNNATVGNQLSRPESREQKSPSSITSTGASDNQGTVAAGSAPVAVSKTATVVVARDSETGCVKTETIPCLNNYLTIKELHDIEEEDDQLEEDPIPPISTFLLLGRQRSDGGSLSPWCRVAVTTTTTPGSTPSPSAQQQYHQKCENRKKKRSTLRNKSSTIGTSTVSPDNTLATCIIGGVSPSSNALSRMQAEQGSIGDLQKYHNRYLRNRRHTLANVG